MLECGEAPKSSLLYVVCRSLPPLSVSLNDLQLSHVCIYVFGDFSLTIENLSNMETKLCLVLHVDHKPLTIQTTQLNRLRNVNAIYSAFYPEKLQLNLLASVYRPVITLARRSNGLMRSMERLCVYV